MRKLLPWCLGVLLAGCVPVFSLHPLYTNETITFEEKLLGTWGTDPNKPDDTWEFTRLEESATGFLPVDLQGQAAKCYRVNFTENKRKSSLIACLVRLQDRLFLNFMPGRFPGGEPDPENADFQLNAMFFLRLHTFVQVGFAGDQLKIGVTYEHGFGELLKAEPRAVTYTIVKENPILIWEAGKPKEHPLLVASTPELQAFVIKYADDKRLFADWRPFTRKPSRPSQ